MEIICNNQIVLHNTSNIKHNIFNELKTIITQLLSFPQLITKNTVDKLCRLIKMYNKHIYDNNDELIYINEETYKYKYFFCCNYNINNAPLLYINTTVYPNENIFFSLQYENDTISQQIINETYAKIIISTKDSERITYINKNTNDIDYMTLKIFADNAHFKLKSDVLLTQMRDVNNIKNNNFVMSFNNTDTYTNTDNYSMHSFLNNDQFKFMISPTFHSRLYQINDSINVNKYINNIFINNDVIELCFIADKLKMNIIYNPNTNNIFLNILPLYEEEQKTIINFIEINCTFDEMQYIDFNDITNIDKIQKYESLKYNYTENYKKIYHLKINKNNSCVYDGKITINPFNTDLQYRHNKYIEYEVFTNNILNNFNNEFCIQYILNNTYDETKYHYYFTFNDSTLNSYKINNSDILHISMDNLNIFKSVSLNECKHMVYNNNFNYIAHLLHNIGNIEFNNFEDNIYKYTAFHNLNLPIYSTDIYTQNYHINLNRDIRSTDTINVVVYEQPNIDVTYNQSNDIEGIVQYGNGSSKPKNDYPHKKDDDYESKNKKIVNISTHIFKKNIEIKHESSSDNGFKLAGINKINDTIGYKAAMTADGQLCMVTLSIPKDAKIVKDITYDKYKTNTATVVAIDRILYDKYKIFKLNDVFMKDDTECPICFDTAKLYICSPCLHRYCIDCINNIRKSTGNECPMCRKTIESAHDITVSVIDRNTNLTCAYSFVHNTTFKYELHNTYTISDFDMNIIGKTCGPGIYYHTRPSDIIQWFGYLEIDNEHANLILQQNKHQNTEMYQPVVTESSNANNINKINEISQMNNDLIKFDDVIFEDINNTNKINEISQINNNVTFEEIVKLNNDFLKEIEDENINDE